MPSKQQLTQITFIFGRRVTLTHMRTLETLGV